ncbi:hypothetical protein K435DRAFT_806000 [Dendrothele bispora CBS 962.96]|uniref:Uncharacterized protein n=1 Tax=Dendrothele bispora (strain CBS 962.96) TaxID=1314807 RepID=A0A4S8L9A1_DENBC|nr:hypothetical protein K435DRAFT_806000 [Dendrothele bispora CBS 962.96]
MGVIFASRIPGVGTSIDLDTDSTYLHDAAVEGSTLASDAQVSSSRSAYSSVIDSVLRLQLVIVSSFTISSTQSMGTQGTPEVASITREGVVNDTGDNSPPTCLVPSVASVKKLLDYRPQTTKMMIPTMRVLNYDCNSKKHLCSSQINHHWSLYHIVKIRIATPPGCYDQSNEGVNLDVASLDNGGGVEASVSRANSRSSQICTGNLRQVSMAHVDNISNAYSTTPGGYHPGVVAAQYGSQSDCTSTLSSFPIPTYATIITVLDLTEVTESIWPLLVVRLLLLVLQELGLLEREV